MALTIHDTALIPSLHKGDQEAFALVFRHFIGPVRYFVEQLVGDQPAAQDIASDVFIRTFQKHTDFPTLEKVKAFLYISARNAALDVT